MSSMRRNTGRDRRGGATVLPSVVSFYTAGISHDYDFAAARVTKDGSDRVSAVTALLGGKNLLQGTAAQQPLWLANGTPNSLPCLQLDSTARNLANLAFTTNTNAAQTHAIVLKRDSGTGYAFIHNNGLNTAGVGLVATGSNRVLQCFGGGANLTDSTFQTSNWEVHVWRLAASGGFGTALDTKELYVNGVLTAVAGAPNILAGTTTFIIGVNGGSMLCKIARYMEATATALSAGDCVGLSQALMRAYGIT